MRKKKMILLLIIFVLIALVILWFSIPYSPFKNQFKKDFTKHTQLSEKFLREASNDVYAEEDFKSLPPLIQTYLEKCGYIGSPRKSILQMEYKKVEFALGQNRPKLKIDYTQVDFANIPARLAFIDSKMFGIPFQGYDYFVNGKGSMKGVLAKLFQLFDQTGEQMDKAALVAIPAALIAAEEAARNFIPNANNRSSNGRTKLMIAAKKGDIQKIEDLLYSGAQIDAKDDEGWTALMYSARFQKDADVTKLLLYKGADRTIKNKYQCRKSRIVYPKIKY